MPLNRANVTIPSRIMLPAYVTLCAGFGAVYIIDPLNRTATNPALAFQRTLLPMPVWGVMFLIIAAGMLVALLVHHRMMFAFALSVCAVTWLLWGALYFVSVFLDDRASVLGFALPWFVTTACIASLVSLIRGDT